ncbi:probable BOI-related E3 ubiquitin-protein ligase 2 [Vigna radiata var. radiata]|uniref:Probable BOI-related E3 ubiquitin-protein ligase 2 n=1 Tax=Vigna radiata var. radiata TaxID=3916 RepID=A0A1S3U3A5_VIGRR|nr:probable BOI-related E3 ubiquitin-protein ligase 2 [Vigna radiata var. radiata]
MAIEAQFYGSNNLMVFFNSQQYKHNLQQSGQQQWLHQARQMTQNTSLVDPVFSSFSNSNAQMNAFHKYNHNAQPLASYPHQSFATQLDEQREIDHYIRSQNEKLRVFLQEQRKQHMAELLKKMEWNALHLLRQKDEEIVEAAKKTRELKEFLTRLEVEKESWRKVAEENEAMVLCLHNNIERMKERAVHGMTSEDAESCCDDNVGITASMGEGTGEKRGRRGGVGEIEEIRKKTMDCKRCNSQKSCFMFLPCRHLCSCKTCEPFLQVCPVCSTPKKSSIETLIV